MKRIVLAFLVAPLAVPALFAAWVLANGASEGYLFLAAMTGLYTYGAALVAGLPAVFLYRHMGWTRAWQFALGGLLLGTAVFAAMAGSAPPVVAAVYGGFGALTAWVFWLVGVRRNDGFAPRY